MRRPRPEQDAGGAGRKSASRSKVWASRPGPRRTDVAGGRGSGREAGHGGGRRPQRRGRAGSSMHRRGLGGCRARAPQGGAARPHDAGHCSCQPAARAPHCPPRPCAGAPLPAPCSWGPGPVRGWGLPPARPRPSPAANPGPAARARSAALTGSSAGRPGSAPELPLPACRAPRTTAPSTPRAGDYGSQHAPRVGETPPNVFLAGKHSSQHAPRRQLHLPACLAPRTTAPSTPRAGNFTSQYFSRRELLLPTGIAPRTTAPSTPCAWNYTSPDASRRGLQFPAHHARDKTTIP